MIRQFTDFLADINCGKLNIEASEELADLIKHCAATGKAGELTLKIKIKPGKGAAKTMTVSHDIKTKVPAFDRPDDHLFVVGNEALFLTPPDQGKLDLRDEPKPPVVVRDQPEAPQIVVTPPVGGTKVVSIGDAGPKPAVVS